MSFANQMASLRTSLDDTKKRTNQAIRKVKKDTNGVLHGAQEMMAKYAQTQKANAHELRKDLESATQSLKEKVKETREKNIGEQKKRRKEFGEAQVAFWGKQIIKNKE